MKTLKNHIILYDAECPMCKVYTRAFTTTGMLDADGRAPYQEMPAFACPLVDQQRAVNEIALVDTVTGEVKYGIDSLFEVVSHSFPLFRPLFAFRPFGWGMRKVYAFISYNRKVIIPAPKGNVHSIQPAFRLRYRIAWLLFTAWIVGCILGSQASLVCGGLLVIHGLLVRLYAPGKCWDYLGNLMTVLLAGALLLLPLKAAAAITALSPALSTGYRLLLTAIILLEYIRRMRLLF